VLKSKNADNRIKGLVEFALDRISSSIKNFHRRYSTVPDDPARKEKLFPYVVRISRNKNFLRYCFHEEAIDYMDYRCTAVMNQKMMMDEKLK